MIKSLYSVTSLIRLTKAHTVTFCYVENRFITVTPLIRALVREIMGFHYITVFRKVAQPYIYNIRRKVT